MKFRVWTPEGEDEGTYHYGDEFLIDCVGDLHRKVGNSLYNISKLNDGNISDFIVEELIGSTSSGEPVYKQIMPPKLDLGEVAEMYNGEPYIEIFNKFNLTLAFEYYLENNDENALWWANKFKEYLEDFDDDFIDSAKEHLDEIESHETLHIVYDALLAEIKKRKNSLTCPNCESKDITDRPFNKECLRCGQKFRVL